MPAQPMAGQAPGKPLSLTISFERLSREPALALIGLLAPLCSVLLAQAPGLSTPWRTALESLVYTLAGVLTAVVVRSDKLTPALVGLGQALLNVALVAGLVVTDAQQAAIMTAVSLAAAAFVRTQVVAPVPQLLSPPRRMAAPRDRMAPSDRPAPDRTVPDRPTAVPPPDHAAPPSGTALPDFPRSDAPRSDPEG